MFRRFTHVMLALLVMFAMMPSLAEAAYADTQAPVEYIERAVDKYGHVTKNTRVTDDYITVSMMEEGYTLDTGKTYVVRGTRVFLERVSVRGEGSVDLILTDDCELLLNEGLRVVSGQTLNIYAQAGGSGKLTSIARKENAAIGGSKGESCGTVHVHGGFISAKVDLEAGGTGAGIGGGKDGNGGTFIMTGGHVEASGGDDLGYVYNAGGAGIGGGDEGNGGTVEIYGRSQLIADGGTDSAGIGGGDGGDGGKVTITGCDYVLVNSGFSNDRHNAIGGGEGSSSDGTLNLASIAKIDFYKEASLDEPEIKDPVAKWDRENYARTKFQVKIVPCDHSNADTVDYTDSYHRTECPTCYLENDPSVAGLHTPDAEGKCTECGHELRDISAVSVTGLEACEYDGTPQVQRGFSVMDGDDSLREGVDYEVSYENNTNAGTATMVLTGKGAYWNSKPEAFAISPSPITKAELEPIADQVCTGSPVEPVQLTFGGKTLARGTDYTVSYQNNINVGTASYQVTGIGNFTGTQAGTFTIIADDQTAPGRTADLGGGAEGVIITNSTGTEPGTIAYTKAPNTRRVTVPASVVISGKTFLVTEIGTKAFKGKKTRTVIIGENVHTIRASAFKSSKATKAICKTRLLTKSSVRKSLKGSKLKTIQVKVGTKADNKKHARAYKKIFTKKNTGKKVRVK